MGHNYYAPLGDSMKICEEFIIHDQLNPKLFDKDNNLKQVVVEKLLAISEQFKEYIEIPLEILDIQLVGSNASYNYTNTSDIDLHIITNFELLDCNGELLQALYNAKKTEFNNQFDIKLYGLEVELYVQDVNAGIESNGIYSVLNMRWIKFPEKITDVPQYNFDYEISKWKNKINKVLQSPTKEGIANLINQLYMIRRNAILVDGEYSKGNLLFKEIRSLGLLQQLKDALKKIISSQLSLESLHRGQIVNLDF